MEVIQIGIKKPGLGNVFIFIIMGIKYANMNNKKFIVNNKYYNILINEKKIEGNNFVINNFSKKSFNKMGKYNKIIDIVNSKNYNDISIFKEIVSNFKIKDDIINKVNDFKIKNFNENTISIGIRSWDRNISIHSYKNISKKSREKESRRHESFDLNIYIKFMEDNPNNNFFIACDNVKYINILKDKFPNKIICYDKNNNFIDDFIELLLLSHNKKFMYTKNSSFYIISVLFSKYNQELFPV
jgi:hypothetical protein